MLTQPLTQSVHDHPKRSRGVRASARPDADEAAILRSLRVLVVEDDQDSRDLLVAVLEGAGCDVCAVASASEAFDAVVTFTPHVMISDIGMPEEDGYSLMRRVRAREGLDGARLKAMALTAFTSEGDQARALSVGFDAHMGKPISVACLLGRVAALMRDGQTV